MPTTVSNQSAEERVAGYVPVSAGRVLVWSRDGGAVARRLKARGTREVIAIEHDAGAEGVLSREVDAVFIAGTAMPVLRYAPGYFEVIVVVNAIACVRDPAEALRQAARLLGAGGLLVLCAPNLQFVETVRMLAEGRWESTDDGGIMDRRHIMFFTAYELNRLAEQTGFTPQRLLPVELADAGAYPLDAEGMLHAGRISIGPLSDFEYLCYRAREVVLLATRNG